MRSVHIKEPIWKDKAVGIPLHKIDDDLIIDISYQDKQENRPFPYKYFIKREDALRQPTRVSRSGLVYKNIRICDMEVHFV